MRKKLVLLAPLLLLAGIVFVAIYAGHHGLSVLEARGTIAEKERNLMLFALGLALIVVIPVFSLLFAFAWRYREANPAATYSPELTGSRWAETIWWLIPGLLIVILSAVTWNSSHALDPFKPLASTTQPLHVQVVSLDWKWLFIYPDYHVASINALQLPAQTPIDLSLTSDAPMNSFWLPQLAGQIYTMPGMSTQLHLDATKIGTYRGQSANISGSGFAGMVFTATVRSPSDFRTWMLQAQASQAVLDQQTYAALARPSKINPAITYGDVAPNLYDDIVMKYMLPSQTNVANVGEATL